MKRTFSTLLAAILIIMYLCAGAQAESYTLKLDEYTAIYAGPGFESGFVKNVGEDGTFTIVEETLGSDGFFWGRLKSGAGWVRVSDAAVEIIEVPYTTRLDADEKIYAGPGQSYGYVKKVSEDGVYTIVEAISGGNSCLWGRLKSGAGWVCLAELEPELSETPYVIALEYWLPIHEGPGYDFGYAASVGENGKYTIVEEVQDYEGNIWGRLKSGAGWIDVTYARTAKDSPFIAAFADDALADQDDCILFSMEESPYSTKVLFLANEKLTNVRFSLLDLGEFDYVPGQTLYQIDTLTEGTPFIADVVFYGDMTMYGLLVTDESGCQRCFTVSISGYDGSLVVEECELIALPVSANG